MPPPPCKAHALQHQRILGRDGICKMGPVVSVDALSVKNRTWVNIEAELQTSDKEVITDSK